MFLEIFMPGQLDSELCARASARQIERAIQHLRPRLPGATFVSTRERDLSSSQAAVLAAIADDQEREFLAALEDGRL
jgi:hypothetical protein